MDGEELIKEMNEQMLQKIITVGELVSHADEFTYTVVGRTDLLELRQIGFNIPADLFVLVLMRKEESTEVYKFSGMYITCASDVNQFPENYMEGKEYFKLLVRQEYDTDNILMTVHDVTDNTEYCMAGDTDLRSIPMITEAQKEILVEILISYHFNSLYSSTKTNFASVTFQDIIDAVIRKIIYANNISKHDFNDGYTIIEIGRDDISAVYAITWNGILLSIYVTTPTVAISDSDTDIYNITKNMPCYISLYFNLDNTNISVSLMRNIHKRIVNRVNLVSNALFSFICGSDIILAYACYSMLTQIFNMDNCVEQQSEDVESDFYNQLASHYSNELSSNVKDYVSYIKTAWNNRDAYLNPDYSRAYTFSDFVTSILSIVPGSFIGRFNDDATKFYLRTNQTGNECVSAVYPGNYGITAEIDKFPSADNNTTRITLRMFTGGLYGVLCNLYILNVKNEDTPTNPTVHHNILLSPNTKTHHIDRFIAVDENQLIDATTADGIWKYFNKSIIDKSSDDIDKYDVVRAIKSFMMDACEIYYKITKNN